MFSYVQGGFQLLDLILPELKSHVIPYKFKSSHWLKLQHSDWRANLVKDFFLQINFPPMRALEFIRDHSYTYYVITFLENISTYFGGFQLLDLIITELKSHMTFKKFKVSHWWKFYWSKKSFTRFALQSEYCNYNQ